jgi:glycosyltransferase involved in cell wall biosynthesis
VSATTPEHPDSGPEPPLRVLLVGMGPPSRGGIPTYLDMLLGDPWLKDRVRFEFLNTTPPTQKRPGAASAANARLAVAHAWQVFRRARRGGVSTVHLNLSPAPVLPLIRALLLAVAGRMAGARVVLHAHTGRLPEAVAGRAYRVVLRATLRVVSVLVVVSEEARVAAARCGPGVVRLENGIDAEPFRTGPKDDPALVAFVGTVCERKGLIDLRDALLALSRRATVQFHVAVVGDGSQEGPGAFERVVAAFGDLDGVEFTGALPAEEVREILARASVFCLPSHWEGFPLSLLEAMAAGTAPIASRVGDIPLMLDEGRAGILVPPKDAPALAQALDMVLSDPVLRARLGRAARERVTAEFGRRRLVQALYGLYLGHDPAL